MAQASADWSRTIFVLTRVTWLQRGPKTLKALLAQPQTAEILSAFAQSKCTPLVVMHVQFLSEALALAKLEGEAKTKALFELHRRKHQNPLFYCTKTEIAYGTLKRSGFDWEPIHAELQEAVEVSAAYLARYLMSRLLRSKSGAPHLPSKFPMPPHRCRARRDGSPSRNGQQDRPG